MVNCLLTISIKVNVLATVESQIRRGWKMKKQTRGWLWNLLCGGGWGGGGAGG